MSERELPNSATAEAGLASIFLHDTDGKTIDECLEHGLQPSMFFHKRLRLIATACIELYSVCEKINKEAVCDVLTRRGKLDEVGKPLIDKLDAEKENEVHALHYVEILKEKEFRRKLIKTAQKAVETDFPKNATKEEILDTITKMFQEAGKNVTKDDVAEAEACRKLVRDRVRELFEEAESRKFDAKGTLALLTSLVKRLNKRFGEN